MWKLSWMVKKKKREAHRRQRKKTTVKEGNMKKFKANNAITYRENIKVRHAPNPTDQASKV